MAKYIDVDTLINTIDGMGGCDADHDTWAEGWDDAIDAVINELEKLPAADVAPVKRGKWKIIKGHTVHDDEMMQCSNCKKIKFNPYPHLYCPFCGAKMEGETG